MRVRVRVVGVVGCSRCGRMRVRVDGCRCRAVA
jgi:hypothetical protein